MQDTTGQHHLGEIPLAKVQVGEETMEPPSKMVESALHNHAGSAEPGIKMFLGGIQVSSVGLHRAGEQGVGCIHRDARGHVHVPDPDGAVGVKSAGVHLLEQAGVLEDVGVVYLP